MYGMCSDAVTGHGMDTVLYAVRRPRHHLVPGIVSLTRGRRRRVIHRVRHPQDRRRQGNPLQGRQAALGASAQAAEVITAEEASAVSEDIPAEVTTAEAALAEEVTPAVMAVEEDKNSGGWLSQSPLKFIYRQFL